VFEDVEFVVAGQTGSDRESHMGQRETIRVTVWLDAEHDADLIAWLADIPPGSRSALIRETWRRGLVEAARWEPVDIEELRRVVVEELGRALAGKCVEPDTGEPTRPDGDLEAEYGEKLDRMLGGLRSGGEDD
jgi:hypothetical protein